jgi:hypothetical protein
MHRVLLTIAYALLVVPAGLVARFLRDPMSRSWPADLPSYWQDPTPPSPVPMTRRHDRTTPNVGNGNGGRNAAQDAGKET